MPEELDALEITIGVSLSVATGKTLLDLEGIVAEMRLSGISDDAIRNLLLADLAEGGIIFGQYKNAVKNMAKNSAEWAGSIASRTIFEEKGIKEFQWVTAGGNVCPDCEDRHLETRSMEEWRLVGLPKSGFSVCRQHCNCVLVPGTYTGENLNEPLRRAERKAELRKKFGR